jgi:hypothetical protein
MTYGLSHVHRDLSIAAICAGFGPRERTGERMRVNQITAVSYLLLRRFNGRVFVLTS